MIRLLFFIDGLGTGGKERQLVELLKGLTLDKRFRIRIISTEKDSFYLPDIIKLAIQVNFLTRFFRWDPTVFIRLFLQVIIFKPHIIHTYGLIPTFFAIPVAKCLRCPLVNGSIRNAFSSGNFKWKMEKYLLSHSDYIIANSKAGLACRGIKESERNIVIYNGYDLERTNGTAGISQSLNVPPLNKKIIGMVAKFSDYKDQPTFIRAAISLLNKRDDVHFVLVGDGKNFDQCKNMAIKYSSEIEFLGQRKDIESIVKNFSIGVLCTFTEGISNSIMEYMAAAKPVIATDGGATNEIVLDGITGFLIPCRDSDCLSEKIESLLDNYIMSTNMGKLGKQRLEMYFSLKKLTYNTIGFYNTILGR